MTLRLPLGAILFCLVACSDDQPGETSGAGGSGASGKVQCGAGR